MESALLGMESVLLGIWSALLGIGSVLLGFGSVLLGNGSALVRIEMRSQELRQRYQHTANYGNPKHHTHCAT